MSALFAWALCLPFSTAPARATPVVPANFEDRSVVGLSYPIAAAFTPDEAILVITRLGQVRVFKDGALQTAPALDLGADVCTNYERGLLGIAVDPGFADQHYVYLYYTYNKGDPACGTDSTSAVNRVSRFLLDDESGADVIDPSSETVLVDNIPSPSGIHNAGDLQFGKDGYLYVSVGDGGCDYSGASGCGPANNAAQYPHVLNGKILRIASDGSVPADNPFRGVNTARCNATGATSPGTTCQEIYASGLRNPFRFGFDSNVITTRFYINDVGLNTWEEIDRGEAGANYGWNQREGPCAVGSITNCGPPPPGMTNPIYAYDHSSGCTSITGGAFVPDGVWPSQYDGSYLFMDFICGKVFQLVPNGAGGYAAAEFASGLGNAISMAFGPYGSSQALYYVTNNPPGLRRIAYTGGANRSPTAEPTATPTSGNLPLQVSFDATGSSDPDGDALTYEWNFGDGSTHSTAASTSHRYTTAGTYTASLTLADGHGGQDTAQIRIDAGNNAPAPVIQTPAAGELFTVGEDIVLSGSATDPEDGTLPAAGLTWEVVKHHASHVHPYLPPTTGNGTHIIGPAPEDFSSATNSYLEVDLTATDSKGLTATVRRDMYPKLVQLGFATQPSGLQLEVNGVAAPSSFTSWAGWNLPLNAPSPQVDGAGQGVTFLSWSDGGAQSHTITTPATAATYTATFTYGYARPRGATPLRTSLVPAYRECASPNTAHGAPLAYGSCSPPAQASGHLTVGTLDANGQANQADGSVTLRAIVGRSSTPADEADARIDTAISDVRSGADLSDYDGELATVLHVRLTDHASGVAQTVEDFPFTVTVPCAVTSDPAIGSSCSLITTADTVVPGAIPEGRRSTWALDQVEVYDGGPDGVASTTTGNTLFETQGIFVP